MRLLTNAGGGVPQLREFISEDNLPPFAILSHTWEDDEVSLQDLNNPSKCINQKGFRKIRETCKLAARNGFQYTWIDTCCIDKQASAELSEAINSMFYWYEKAAVCCVYLSDLTPEDAEHDLGSALRNCRWWSRGWTLQELIAPRNVWFYDRDWKYRGSKARLSETISSITNIPVALLRHEKRLSDFSVACRMSWVSKRQTTRVEDMSYCMLGIFDVNMPLIYGEREKAFFRLQQEVLQATGDLSIFAWTDNQPAGREYSGLLAESPTQFSRCSGMEADTQMPVARSLKVTSLEIEMQVGLRVIYAGSGDGNEYPNHSLLHLFSSVEGHSLGLYLSGYWHSQYMRWRPDRLVKLRLSNSHIDRETFWVTPTDGTAAIGNTDEHWIPQQPTRTISLPPRLPRSLVGQCSNPGPKLFKGDTAVGLDLDNKTGETVELGLLGIAPESHWDYKAARFFCVGGDDANARPTGWVSWYVRVGVKIPGQGRSRFSVFILCFLWNSMIHATYVMVHKNLLIGNLLYFNLGRIKFEDWAEASELVGRPTDSKTQLTDGMYREGESITVGTLEETEVILRCVSEHEVLPHISSNPVLNLVLEAEVKEKVSVAMATPING